MKDRDIGIVTTVATRKVKMSRPRLARVDASICSMRKALGAVVVAAAAVICVIVSVMADNCEELPVDVMGRM